MKAYPRNARQSLPMDCSPATLESRNRRFHRLERSGGTMRTESWNRLPIIRMTNISILPGTWRYEDLIADTEMPF